MKKQFISAAVVGSLLVSGVAHAETKPSDLARTVKSYDATMQKTVSAYDMTQHKVIKMYKGKKITIVERKNLDGYDYLIAKGNIYIPINNTSVKINKSLSSKIDYNQYHMSKTLVSELKKLGTKHPDYANYKRDAISYEKEMKRGLDAFMPSVLAYKLHNQTVIPAGVGGVGPMTYKVWKTSNYQPSQPFKPNCPVQKGNALKIFSTSFKQHFFGTKSYQLNKTKPGNIADFKYAQCKMVGTGYGYFLSNGNVGFTLKRDDNFKVKRTAVIATYPYSYNTIIKKYGQPTSVKEIVNRVHETQITYNQNKKDGYKVVIGFDKNKGKMKYMIKLQD